MRLSALTVRNFKSIGEQGVRIEFAPITMLFGPNNAGKSTVIQALHLMREVLCRGTSNPDRVEGGGDMIDLGGFQQFVHKHDLSRTVSISIEMDLEGEDLPSFVRQEEIQWQELYALAEAMGNHRDSGIDCPYWEKIEHLTVGKSQENAWALAQDILNRIPAIGLQLNLSWGHSTQKAFVSEYAISMGGIEIVSIQCKENGKQQFEGVEFSQFLLPEEESKCREYIKANLIVEDESVDEATELPVIVEHLYGIIDFDSTWEALEPGSSCSDYCPAEPEIINPEIIGSALPLWDRPLDLSEITDSKVATAFLSSLLVGPGLLLREFFQKRIQYIGPLRDIPPRNYIPRSTPSADRWENGLAAWDTLFTADQHEIEEVNRWLNGPDSLQIGYRVEQKTTLFLDLNSPLAFGLRVAALDDFDESVLPLLRQFLGQPSERKIVFKHIEAEVEVTPHDMGTGISQVIPVVVAAVLPKRGAFIAIEQPELHMHPKVQVALGDVFVNAVAEKDNNPMFLLETHSEHLLLRLLRRIRHTHNGTAPHGLRLTSNDVSVCWVGADDGQTYILPLELDKKGFFMTPWPEGFFDERGEEMFG